jgi:hypothetical protein
MRSLDDYLNSIDQVAIGDGRRCHRLVWFLRLSAFYPTRAITFQVVLPAKKQHISTT